MKPTVLPPPKDEDVKVALDFIQSRSSPSSEAANSTGDLLRKHALLLIGVFRGVLVIHL